MRLVVVDDLPLIRDGIRSALLEIPDIELVGEASNCEDALRLVRELHPPPHVVIMDAVLPDGCGLEVTRKIKETLPAVEVLVMTDRLDDHEALDAIEAGATGYLLKDIPRENLIRAVRAVHDGRAFFHPHLTRKMLDQLGQLARRQRARLSVLTERELQILTELAGGATDAEIARKYVVSVGTVKTHIRNILRKLGCRNRTQVVAYVFRKGLIK